MNVRGKNLFDINNQDIKINACSGGIYKTYKESYFKFFHADSCLASNLFSKESKKIVLQLILMQDNCVIAEIIDKQDFDKYFEKVGKENE